MEEKINYHQMLYRNQFIMGSEFDDRLDNWKRMELDNDIKLQVHPDLGCYKVVSQNKWIVLLGFIVDPDNIQDNNTDIINKLLNGSKHYTDIIQKSNRFGGRWILIINDGEHKIILNDAIGLRQIFYSDPSLLKNGIWCASQPALIGHKLDLTLDKEAIVFADSHQFRTNTDYRWPGNRSQYKEVLRLLPNHFLDLDDGKVTRFWPDKNLVELPMDLAIEKIAQKMQGLLEAVSRRYDLSISVTAGIDSRLVLAASKKIKEDVNFATIRQIDKPEDHPDITISSQMLQMNGLSHDVLKSSLVIDNNFSDLFTRHNFLSHHINLYDAYAYLKHYNLRKTVVTGSGSEIARDNYRRKLNLSRKQPITVSGLVRLFGMQDSSFVKDSFESWLSGITEPYNIDVMNLCQWELSHGTWLANNCLEYDLAWNDIFTPYNCRDLLVDFLSVNETYRIGPRYSLHRAIIQHLWPELLEVPVNPHRRQKNKISRSTITKHIPPSIKKNIKDLISNKKSE